MLFVVSPGSFVFHRDMLLTIPIISDINCIRTCCQLLIDRAGIDKNNCQQVHNYHIGDQIAIILKDPDALAERTTTPFTIVNVHTNGTVSHLKNPNIIARINICYIKTCIK